jgi:hypothetical protein
MQANYPDFGTDDSPSNLTSRELVARNPVQDSQSRKEHITNSSNSKVLPPLYLPVKGWDWKPALSSNILIGATYLTNKNTNINMGAGPGTCGRISFICCRDLVVQ